MNESIFKPGATAVITGAAMGIGLAAATRCAEAGMNVCLADVDGAELDAVQDRVARAAQAAGGEVMSTVTDVGDGAAMDALREMVERRLGPVGFLMNNAVTRVGGGVWGDPDDWRRAMDVNFWGVVNGVRSFVPAMIEGGTAGAVVNVGSKQGITNPPGNTVYNVTKAAVKHYTEALAHELRNTENCRVTAHLLVPGWTTTGKKEHKPGAWLPEQVVERMIDALGRGDFYIVCPDGEVSEEMDRQRIRWAAGDITENRPALSRWHPDFKEAFETDAG
ncbi:MAG: SDR family NAD(P)-dependent oxidoreductase [Magnetovibrio sp.]|nr:SDR family NAD(P)-dependent oxidoreductase [Magnetovibrio sp.]